MTSFTLVIYVNLRNLNGNYYNSYSPQFFQNMMALSHMPTCLFQNIQNAQLHKKIASKINNKKVGTKLKRTYACEYVERKYQQPSKNSKDGSE